ncbi:hypothetical protein N657DRAFT_325890 [Parathielavia appendiculata]|uniref:Uncharacterized protein n=1 Tax=Parathielavia appendiculata TaxID=2587402 RepID=A0AAN6TQK7_9PEZI|nr:hypothetical protein N657DRAFT_325890 [Parathielavia appendiculata]
MGNHLIDDDARSPVVPKVAPSPPDAENRGAKPLVTTELPSLTTCQIQQVPPIQQSGTHLSGLVTSKLWAAIRPCSSLSCITRAARLRLQHGIRARCASSSFSPF